jgi:transcriptional regulator with XRE-family HTH domain
MKFSQILSNYMKTENVTSYALSKGTGISDSLIGYYRSGKNSPSAENLIKIADFFNCSIDYLVGRTDNPAVNE